MLAVVSSNNNPKETNNPVWKKKLTRTLIKLLTNKLMTNNTVSLMNVSPTRNSSHASIRSLACVSIITFIEASNSYANYKMYRSIRYMDEITILGTSNNSAIQITLDNINKVDNFDINGNDMETDMAQQQQSQ
ncbi:3414_t:CDS:2 [Funneliformis mosseae]|uniref:3414_t:CDS:1 n=1 Tax=Funneliformis mosseae TaxID=27381 RepID=A0A9N9AIR0_FUNMO|nr:3414_t:CDS:2 [Funneliformis mosseae]